ncbi:competence protein ComGC [Streptococcus chenjunshii]|uniref:Competence protein ComGC n=1 Tax=Streptococcus chenjunshii TaxID=2173853 RepID=A0A372KL36_9STRE|nr:competence type IV pilus major pilin ComGC [Streptococcus chenjunshii]AXQ77709.1 competence protein ComGC [Streptococcus chenjunshii]RFU50849.1 competence protein ComGC [Streptococcus chenjunshii]RFU52995.1 competence protein ComGC [Streptococcus chenjunshii]
MKKILIAIKEGKAPSFTLLEMLFVLLIISVLLLLFVPNLAKQKDKVNNTGNAAVVKVVESQAELYELNENAPATLSKLVAEGSISAKQQKAYNDYYAKNSKETRRIAN